MCLHHCNTVTCVNIKPRGKKTTKLKLLKMKPEKICQRGDDPLSGRVHRICARMRENTKGYSSWLICVALLLWGDNFKKGS